MESTNRPDDHNNSLAKRKAEEYEMQLFGLHSRTVIAGINQKVKENVDVRCQKMYESIEIKYNPGVEQKELLKSNVRQLRKMYRHNMQPHLKTIENIVHKFINIPDNVLLKEDHHQKTQYNNEEMNNLENRLEYLQKEAKRVTVFNALLKEELETTKKLKETEDMAKRLCNLIDKGLSAKKIKSKMLREVDKIKVLTESLDSLQPVTQKKNYNPRLHDCHLEQVFLDK